MFQVDEKILLFYSNLSDIATFFLSIISLLVLGYIAFKSMQYTAKPKLKIKILNDESLIFETLQKKSKNITRPIVSYWLFTDRETVLKFLFINQGHWYAKPAIVIDEFGLTPMSCTDQSDVIRAL